MNSRTNKDRRYDNDKDAKASKVAQLMGGGKTSPSKGASVYTDFSDESIGYAVRITTGLGGAIMFGQTSDGYTGSVTIFYGNERIKGYILNPSDPSQALVDWIEKFRIAVEES